MCKEDKKEINKLIDECIDETIEESDRSKNKFINSFVKTNELIDSIIKAPTSKDFYSEERFKNLVNDIQNTFYDLCLTEKYKKIAQENYEKNTDTEMQKFDSIKIENTDLIIEEFNYCDEDFIKISKQISKYISQFNIEKEDDNIYIP